MKKAFVERYQLHAKISPSLLQQMFRDLTGDCSTPSSQISKDVQSRLLLALSNEDPDLAFDLRHLDDGRPESFTAFRDSAKAF